MCVGKTFRLICDNGGVSNLSHLQGCIVPALQIDPKGMCSPERHQVYTPALFALSMSLGDWSAVVSREYTVRMVRL